MKRRTFLSYLSVSGGVATAAIVVAPSAITALSPLLRRRAGPQWATVGPLARFPAGGVAKAAVRPEPGASLEHRFEPRGVFVWRPAGAELVVFSRACTDLGCPVTWDPGSGWYFCPCHGGIFAADGANVSGPPPRPLRRYAHRVREGVLEIDLGSLPPGA